MGQIIDFSKALPAGIRPDSRSPRNSLVLKTCTNLRPTRWGLKDFITIRQPVEASALTSAGITPAWPFPQLFRAKGETLLFDSAAVFRVTETGSGTWTLAAITTKDADNLGSGSPSNKAITADGPWHFMDFYDFWMAFNGSCCVFQTGYDANVWVQDSPLIGTGCAFWEGRGVYGNLPSAKLTAWDTFLDTYDGTLPAHVSAVLDNTQAMGSNWVWWSSIGGEDMLSIFSQSLMEYGAFGSPTDTGFGGTERPYIFDVWRRNECGARPMPWQGTVLKVQPLGQHLMVYGDGGVSALTPQTTPAVEFNVSTFSLQDLGLDQFGVAGRSAAGGDDQGHMFVDAAGELWFVAPNLQTERLGHGELFSGMDGSEIVISKDPQRKEFYISDGTDTYVRTETGMGKAPWAPTTIHFAQGTLVGHKFDAADPDSVTVRTETIDFGTRTVKELRRVLLHTTDTEGWTCQVHYRNDKSAAFTSTSTFPIRAQGDRLLNIAAVEFEVSLFNAERTECNLDALQFEVILGSGAPELRGYL